MGKRNKNAQGRSRRATGTSQASLRVIPNKTVPAPRDWDSDAPDENAAYSTAVSTVLERLDGLWYDSSYNHPDPEDKYQWETEVNNYLQGIKLKIQEML